SGEFAPQRFGPAQWIENGAAYTTVERSAAIPDASDIVRYETGTGARSIYVSARQLVPSGTSGALDIDDYGWSADGNLLLLFTNTQRVWRQNTRGDYWILNRKTDALKKLGGPNAPPSSLMYAKFSPAGDRVAYVRQGNVYVERLSDGAITALTSDADSLHVNGMTDWVYEEEFELRDAFRWSPDGSKVAYWRVDMTGLGTYFLVNDAALLLPKITPIQYPKAGTTNSAVRAGVVSAEGGPTTWLQIPDRKSTRLNSSHLGISYAVFCLKKKKKLRAFVIRIVQVLRMHGHMEGDRSRLVADGGSPSAAPQGELQFTVLATLL